MTIVKGKGKGKALKVKQETLPTPQGRRIVPRITSVMKAEANRKVGKKAKVCHHLYMANQITMETTVLVYTTVYGLFFCLLL